MVQIGREVFLFPDANPLEGMFLHGWWEGTKGSDYKIYGNSLGLNSLVPSREQAGGGFLDCANHRTRFLVSRSGWGSMLPILSIILGTWPSWSAPATHHPPETWVCWSHLHPQWPNPKETHPLEKTELGRSRPWYSPFKKQLAVYIKTLKMTKAFGSVILLLRPYLKK